MADDDTLRSVLGRLHLRDVLRLDCAVGLAGGTAGLILGLQAPARLIATVGAAANIAGAVIGLVLATTAIVVAFLNAPFLRKMGLIGEDPADFLAPYFFTGVLATVAALGLVALAASGERDAPAWLATAGAVTGLTFCWAVASTVPNLTNLLRFIRVQQTAAEIEDDAPALREVAPPRSG